MPRVHGSSAAWLHSLAISLLFRDYVVLASISAEPLIGLSSASLQEARQMQQTVTPDCGLAFQPCCPGEESCLNEEFSCIAREPIARCEPCGTPFAQPCPQAPYCEATELIPTTSALHYLDSDLCYAMRKILSSHASVLLQGDQMQRSNAGHADRSGNLAVQILILSVEAALCAMQSKIDAWLQNMFKSRKNSSRTVSFTLITALLCKCTAHAPNFLCALNVVIVQL
jgi:hypothetical protein